MEKQSKFKNSALTATVLICGLVLTGCSQSSVIAALTTIVDATAVGAAVVTTLASNGTLAGPSVALALDYIEHANTAAAEAINEWESTDTVSQKITKITEDFAAVGVSGVTGLNNSEVESVIKAVSTAVQAFLSQIHAGTARAHALGLSQKAVLPLSYTDKHKLGSLKAKAQKTKTQIELWRAAHTAKSGN